MKTIFVILRLVAVSTIIFCVIEAKAQDTLIKMNESRLVTRIIEINPKTIKYKNFSNPDGPDIIIDRRDVSRIVYANGTVDSITVKKSPFTQKNKNPDPRKSDYGKNNFTFMLIDIILGMASVGYERILPGGNFSIKIPISVGFQLQSLPDSTSNYPKDEWLQDWGGSGYYYQNKIFSTGIEAYYYTGGQSTISYFIGPSFEFGMFNYQHRHYRYFHQPQYNTKETGNYFAFLIKNGVKYQTNRNFNFSFNVGAGLFTQQTKNFHEENNTCFPFGIFENSGAFEFGIMAGYSF